MSTAISNQRSAHDLDYLSEEAFERLARVVVEVKRMLASFLGKVKAGS